MIMIYMLSDKRQKAADAAPHNSSFSSGVERLLEYMERCRVSGRGGGGDDEDEEGEGGSSWARAQGAAEPTLLPNLKFHDLVFGK